MPYNCTICGDNERAAFLITPLSGGDSTAFGENCAPIVLSSMLAAFLGLDADKVYDTLAGMTSDEASAPERPNLPSGYVYGPNGEDVLSEDDVDAGLCGLIHDDWWHCHRKANHSGKHGRAEARKSETAQPPPPDVPPTAELVSGAK